MPSDEKAFAFEVGQPVEKFTGEALWSGVVVSRYHTTKGGERYVVEVKPQGFQMIAVPSQLRTALAAAEAGEPVLSGYGDYTPVTIRAGTVASPPSEASRDERAAIRKEAFEEAAKIADYGMLVPPDGGSPTQGECDVAERIATAIRARGER